MLYLDEVSIHNFKSFKNATIKFNKGFNCIVGPNGSGKSNICDSLLFALGETSLKRMRVNKSLLLINNLAKPSKDDGIRKAYVKVRFSGEKDIEIMRYLKSNQKMGYRLNGKRTTRQEVVEVLKSYKAQINDTNTMTQGEITYLLNLNPKERRTLIDTAAGISEFNEKRDVSLKELEKVDIKINESRVMLKERSGFLDTLEKEKEGAERFTELTNMIKATSYTLLRLREKDIAEKLAAIVEELAKKEATKKDFDKRITEIEAKIGELSTERERISKNLTARSAELGATNKILEEINKNIAIGSTKLGSLNDTIKASKDRLSILESEQKKTKSKEKENTEAIKKLDFELQVKSKDLPEDESGTEGEGAGHMSLNHIRLKINK